MDALVESEVATEEPELEVVEVVEVGSEPADEAAEP